MFKGANSSRYFYLEDKKLERQRSFCSLSTGRPFSLSLYCKREGSSTKNTNFKGAIKCQKNYHLKQFNYMGDKK
jgi:hypothetical protein